MIVLVGTLFVYLPTLQFDFVNFDDDLWVTDNPTTQAGLSVAGLVDVFRGTVAGHWVPLTWWSHQAAFELFGLNAGGHHLLNLLLHATTALLLMAALVQLTGAVGRSGWVAAIFAVHPTHVESVAWITERKDVLSGVFFGATLLAYAFYARRPAAARYAVVLFSLGLGLLSKSMLVTVPLVLLMLDFWPLERAAASLSAGDLGVRRVLLEKIPLLMLSLLAGGIAIASVRDLVASSSVFSWDLRLKNAAVSTVRYLETTLWPHDLAVFYPSQPFIAWGWALAAMAILATITVGVLKLRRQRPYLGVGWLWFLLMLAPVSGLIQAGAIARADRYTYLPAIGLYLAAVWLAGDLVARAVLPIRVAAIGAGTMALVGLAYAGRSQAETWRNSETLFQRAVAVTEGNYLAHHNLAQAYLAAGRREPALFHFQKALSLASYPATHAAFGGALRSWGRADEALAELDLALSMDEGDARAHLFRAMTLDDLSRPSEAIAELQRAVELAPGLATAHQGLGALFSARGEINEALRHYRAAIEADPRLGPTLLPVVASLIAARQEPRPREEGPKLH